MTTDRALNAFLQQYLDDQSSGRRRPLAEYQAASPGNEALIAEWYRLYESGQGSPSPDPAASNLMRIGAYRVLREIGRGGQGVVYLAEDEQLHRRAAVKVLTGLGAIAPDRVARFLREAEVASRLNHPGIATVYGIGVQGAVPYIAMQYVEGQTLAAWLGESLDVGAIVRVVAKTARALHAAHEAGVVHRDVKPGNVIIDEKGDPVLLDFGLAHDADGELAPLTRTGDFFGTPAYMSPEQIAIQRIRPDRRTDVWSLGATLYEALARRRPFDAPTREQLYRAILVKEPEDLRRVRPEVSRDLAAIVETALAKDVDRRYQTAAAMADDLEALLAGRPVAARRLGPAGRLWRWTRREPALAAFLALALVALPVIAVLVTNRLADAERLESARLAKLREDKDEILAKAFHEIGEGSADAARVDFDRVLAMEGGSPEAVAGLALAHLKRKRWDEALSALDRHAAEVSGLRAPAMLRATALRYLNRNAEADAITRAALPLRDPVDHYVLGERLMQEGHDGRTAAFREAMIAFRNAIYLSVAPRSIYFQGLAHAAGHVGDGDAAREMADALRRHWPASAPCLRWAGVALSGFAPDEALALLKEAIRVDPAYVDGLNSLGGILRDQHQPEEAIPWLREAVRLRPDYADAYFQLGSALVEAGRPEEALVWYRDGLARKPSYAVGRAALAAQLKKLGRIDEAIAEFREAIRIAPRYADAHSDLGNALLLKGRTQDALACYRAALAIDPAHANAQNNLRFVLDSLEDGGEGASRPSR